MKTFFAVKRKDLPDFFENLKDFKRYARTPKKHRLQKSFLCRSFSPTEIFAQKGSVVYFGGENYKFWKISYILFARLAMSRSKYLATFFRRAVLVIDIPRIGKRVIKNNTHQKD